MVLHSIRTRIFPTIGTSCWSLIGALNAPTQSETALPGTPILRPAAAGAQSLDFGPSLMGNGFPVSRGSLRTRSARPALLDRSA